MGRGVWDIRNRLELGRSRAWYGSFKAKNGIYEGFSGTSLLNVMIRTTPPIQKGVNTQ